ncbi:MAG: hypothetical protein KDC66_04345 [Phaeodactylibacter sp.]|nr:hypothetical protein [Phaeodactylibacter sp.]
MAFEESRLRFNFLEGHWEHLVKYDEEKDYRKLEQSIPGTKGVDFIGISNHDIFFFEVKNYRGHKIASKQKIDELEIIVAQKVRDTLGGIVGGVRNSTNREESWQQHLKFLGDKKKRLNIVLWIEEDPRHRQPKEQNIYSQILTQKLKQHLSWLSCKVIVANKANNPIIDKLQVDFLPEH